MSNELLNEEMLENVSGGGVGSVISAALGAKEGPIIDYKIVKGDCLSVLAQKFRTSVKRIMELNPKINNENLIFADDIIKIPDNRAI